MLGAIAKSALAPASIHRARLIIIPAATSASHPHLGVGLHGIRLSFVASRSVEPLSCPLLFSVSREPDLVSIAGTATSRLHIGLGFHGILLSDLCLGPTHALALRLAVCVRNPLSDSSWFSWHPPFCSV
jgi:hypothetical protein